MYVCANVCLHMIFVCIQVMHVLYMCITESICVYTLCMCACTYIPNLELYSAQVITTSSLDPPPPVAGGTH